MRSTTLHRLAALLGGIVLLVGAGAVAVALDRTGGDDGSATPTPPSNQVVTTVPSPSTVPTTTPPAARTPAPSPSPTTGASRVPPVSPASTTPSYTPVTVGPFPATTLPTYPTGKGNGGCYQSLVPMPGCDVGPMVP